MRALVVTVAWPTDEHPLSGNFVKQQVASIRGLGLEIDVFHFAAGQDPRNYARARRAIRRRLGERSYDLVHVHFGQTGFAVPMQRPPLVVTFHGSDLEGIVAKRGGYALRSVLLRRMSRMVARRADRVIVQSRRQGARLPAGVGHSVIPMGIDLDVFRPVAKDAARRSLGLEPGRKIVLFSGDPAVPVKRYRLAERAVRSLGVNVADLITVTGQPREVVAASMNASDVLLITSLHESGPLMAKEALACNLPIISLDVGDVRELVADIDGCEVVKDASPISIAGALNRVLVRGRRVDGRTRASVFGAEAIARRVVAVYEGVVRPDHPSR